MIRLIFLYINKISLSARIIFIFLVFFGILGGIFFNYQSQEIYRKNNAELIYKINQQQSIIKHIQVLARYFLNGNTLPNPDAPNASSNATNILHPNVTLSATSKAAEAARYLSTRRHKKTQPFEYSHTRNELRDLAQNLQFLNTYITTKKNTLPSTIAHAYFNGTENIQILINQYIEATLKLSQLPREENNDINAHIIILADLQQRIDHTLSQVALMYYQYLVSAIITDNQNYWLYVVVLFLLLGIGVIFGLVKPLIQQVKSAQEQAEIANRIKTEFLSSVSHEIRTPMHGIISASENLKSTRLDDKQSSYVRTVLSSAESLLDVINDILGYSALESGETQAETTRFNVYELVQDLVQIMEERAQIKNLDLILRYEDGTPHELGGDSSLVRQVLYHLLSNAIKFTEAGYIVVTIGAIPTPENNKSVTLRFAIEDTGIGIETSKLSFIFEQFVQGHGGTKRLFSGTGLGLAICKKLVHLMGGSIHVGSVLGEGSTFSFTIPFTSMETLIQNPTNHYRNTVGLIVFVSDDIDFRNAALSELGMAGMHLVCKTSDELVNNPQETLMNANVVAIDYFVKALSPIKILQLCKEYSPEILALCATRKCEPSLIKNLEAQGFAGVFRLPTDAEALIDFTIKTLKTHHRNATSQALHSTAANAHNYLQNATILLVEDNRINAALAEDMLIDLGAKVIHTENGQEAVNIIKQGQHVDLVLMDCMMPVMDGFEATQLIRALPQVLGKNLPIIALTANAMVGDKERCLNAGMDAYLSKPVRKKDLQTTLSKWLQRRQNAFKKPDKNTGHAPTKNVTHATNHNKIDEPSPKSDSLLISESFAQSTNTPEDNCDKTLPQTLLPSQTPFNHTDQSMAANKPHATPAQQIIQAAPAIINAGNVNSIHTTPASPDTAPASTLQYLDIAAVEKARAMMKKRFHIMIDYYLEDTQNYIEQIQEGLKHKDYSKLVVPAHTIKSSSRQMGAFAVSDLGKEIETLAREESVNFNDILVLTEQLQEQFDLSRIDFNHLLSEAS